MFQILIADSDRAYRRRLYQLLRREGYSVLQASGGEDVLKVLETSYIDFIILGDNLVDLNVYELMRQLRDTYSDMPLMLLAEKKERDGLRKSYMAGADEYLTKPCRKDRLLARVSNILKRYEGRTNLMEGPNFLLDQQTYTLYIHNTSVVLPKNQGKLLVALLASGDALVTTEQLCLSIVIFMIWGNLSSTQQLSIL